MIEGLVSVVERFAQMGHSGGSASIAAEWLGKLLHGKPLTDLTDDPDEWEHHPYKGDCGEDLWQNRRNSAAISVDGGKTYWLVDGEHDSTIHQSQPSGKASS
jgi:hypothetical protein